MNAVAVKNDIIILLIMRLTKDISHKTKYEMVSIMFGAAYFCFLWKKEGIKLLGKTICRNGFLVYHKKNRFYTSTS